MGASLYHSSFQRAMPSPLLPHCRNRVSAFFSGLFSAFSPGDFRGGGFRDDVFLSGKGFHLDRFEGKTNQPKKAEKNDPYQEHQKRVSHGLVLADGDQPKKENQRGFPCP